MTQPDKWDEVVDAIIDNNDAWNFGELSLLGVRKLVAAALRSAYAEGERAGLDYANQKLDELIAAIRAARETKE